MSEQRPTLLLIDGHALAFRAFHALREAGLRASTGEPTYAVFGFLSIMLGAVDEYHPAHLAVSFDLGRTFRDDMYTEYKAGRAETPEEFHPQLERMKQVITALNIPIYTAENFEADDVIGTLSVQAAQQGVASIILTGDTDTLQLVNDHVQVLLANPYARGRNTTMYDEAAVIERYKGLKPNQLADLRGLKGDATDNIPGVKGIGEAGAIALLLQFGTVENLYDHLADVPKRYQKPLEGQREAALFSKTLATIVCDAPVQLDLAATQLGDYDRAAVIALFQEMEMGATLIKRLPTTGRAETYDLPEPTPVAPAPKAALTSEGQTAMFDLPATLPTVESETSGTQQLALFDLDETPAGRAEPLVKLATAIEPAHSFGSYRAITTEQELTDLVSELAAAPAFAFDTESDGLRSFDSKLVGISLALRPGTGVYIPVGHTTEEVQLDATQVLNALRPFFSDPHKPKYAHNAKFDIEMLHHAGVAVEGVTFDTMLAAALLDKRKGLKDLAFYELRLPEPMTAIEDLIGKGKTQITFDQVPIAAAVPYATADADMTLRLVEALRPQLEALPKVNSIFNKLEMPLVPVLVRMEAAGIGIDAPYMRNLGQRLGQRIGELEQEIYAYNDNMPFNIGSGQQLSSVLLNKVGLDFSAMEKTKTGQYSLTAITFDALREKNANHPNAQIIDLILQHRQLTKLKSTYVDSLPELVNSQDGRIHTTYSQLGAATGRLSSNDPNLQNIPTRTDEGREIRRGFVAQPGHQFVAADYSQIELRILAHITQDANLIQTFIEGRDIHAATAAQIFNVAQDKVDKNQRRVAKCVAAGTLVATERGIVPIEQLGAAAPGEVSELALLVAQEGDKRQQATGFYNGAFQPTIRITTARGYVLEATAQHQVRSIDLDGTYIWRRLGDLATDEYVALGRGAMLFGTDQSLNIANTRRNDKQYRIPERLTPLFARFLGYFVAEGNVAHSRTSDSVLITNKDPDVLADLRQISLAIFGCEPKSLLDKNGVTRLTWHSSRLVDLLLALGVGEGALNKQIPAVVLQGSQESVCEFLRAFFEGDGSISESYISAGSKSLVLIRQLQTVLLNFGIVCYLEHRDIVGHGRHYKLRIIGRESRELFAQQIGLTSQRKSARLAALITRRVTNEPVTLPFQKARLERLYPKTKRELKETIHTCIRTLSPTIQLTYRRLGTIVDQFPERDDTDLQVLIEHRERNLFYDRVVRIEQSESHVYDLVVPETHTYIANGFVSHNTIVFGVIYGISSFGLAPRISASRSEAQALIDALFARFPGIREYIDRTLNEGRRDGYVQSLFGRRRVMPELKTGGPRRQAAEREAINAPIQATAADIMKIAMIRVDEALHREQVQARLLLQVHDELILEAPDHEVEQIAALVKREMEGAFTLSVPLGVDVEVGPNWLEMKDVA